jgi:hypothetical protein
MPDDHPILLSNHRPRADLADIANDMQLMRAQLKRIPTRNEVVRIAFLAILGAAGLTSLFVSVILR